jgi:hypothetical protein
MTGDPRPLRAGGPVLPAVQTREVALEEATTAIAERRLLEVAARRVIVAYTAGAPDALHAAMVRLEEMLHWLAAQERP